MWFICSVMLLTAALHAGEVREIVYGGAASFGGDIVPRYDNGNLIYLRLPNRLQMFGPDTKPLFDETLACPGTANCGLTSVAADTSGNIAIGFSHHITAGRANGIRIVNRKGQQVRFIETALYLPSHLAYDRKGDLWTLGWQRSSTQQDFESKEDYNLVRKFSGSDGKLLVETLPRSLWPVKSSPGSASGGYWTMTASKDRIGAIIHESFANVPAEWVEWDLTGKVTSRTQLNVGFLNGGRAFSASGRLYGRFVLEGSKPPQYELRVLDTVTGRWNSVPDNLPEEFAHGGAFLQGTDGDDLVYRVSPPGNVRLILARPGAN